MSNTYPTTTGGNTRGKSTKILSIEIQDKSIVTDFNTQENFYFL